MRQNCVRIDAAEAHGLHWQRGHFDHAHACRQALTACLIVGHVNDGLNISEPQGFHISFNNSYFQMASDANCKSLYADRQGKHFCDI